VVDLKKPAACQAAGLKSAAAPAGTFCLGDCWIVVTVPFDVALHQQDTAKNAFHWADKECWKLGGSLLVQLEK
jgi:hypothetical protein